MRALTLLAGVLMAAACQRGASEKQEGAVGNAAEGDGPVAATSSPVWDGGTEAALAGIPEARPAGSAPGHAVPAPWLDGAERIAVASGREPRIVVAGTGWSRLLGVDGKTIAEAGGVGSTQVLEVLAIDRDGSPAAVIGRGLSRSARNAPASVTVHRLDRFASAEEVPLPPTTRAQVVGVAADPRRPGVLHIGLFTSKYEVAIVRAERGKDGVWKSEEVAEKRMVWALASEDLDGDGAAEIAVARVYGDSREEPGDLLIVEADGGAAVTRVPSVRGVRSVLAMKDGDGPAYLLYSDGWHRQYRRRALALLTRAHRTDGGWQTEVLANVGGRYSYEHLRVGDLDGDGAREVIAVGNGPAVRVALDRSAGGGASALGGEEAHDAQPVDLDGDGADEVLLIGPDPDDTERGRGWIWRTVDP